MKRASGSSSGNSTKKRNSSAEAERLRVALVEAEQTLQMAGAALRGHQGDYHYTSYYATESIEQVLVRVKAALSE